MGDPEEKLGGRYIPSARRAGSPRPKKRSAPDEPRGACHQPGEGLGRDTAKREVREEQEKEEGGPYPPSPRLLEGILVPLRAVDTRHAVVL